MNEMGTDRQKGGMEEVIERAVSELRPESETGDRERRILRSLVSATARRCADVLQEMALAAERAALQMEQGSLPDLQIGKTRVSADAWRQAHRKLRDEFGLDPAGADKEGGR